VARLGHRTRIRVEPEVDVHGPDGVLGRAADHRFPHLWGQPAAEFGVQRGQRDVPQFLGIDEGAIHIEQHGLHATDSVMAATYGEIDDIASRKGLAPLVFVCAAQSEVQSSGL
jgi:hypothetical protein